jgi:hypothetical protein
MSGSIDGVSSPGIPLFKFSTIFLAIDSMRGKTATVADFPPKLKVAHH